MSVQPSGPVRARRFGNPLPSGPLPAQRPHGERSNQAFEPLPRPTGSYPYRLSLVDTIPGAAEALAGDRHAMTQPNVYWTLLTPRLTISGLYTNVPEGGRVKNDQAAWLREELSAAAPDLPVIVALHHPVYSLDGIHGGDPELQRILDT